MEQIIYGYADEEQTIIEPLHIQINLNALPDFIKKGLKEKTGGLLFNGVSTYKMETPLEKYLRGNSPINASDEEKAGFFYQDQVSISKKGVSSKILLVRRRDCNLYQIDSYIKKALCVKKTYVILSSSDPSQKLDGFMTTSTDKNDVLNGHIYVSPLVHGAFLIANNKFDILNSFYSEEEIGSILDLFVIGKGNLIKTNGLFPYQRFNMFRDIKLKETVYKAAKRKII